jgi:hypothetical protein
LASGRVNDILQQLQPGIMLQIEVTGGLPQLLTRLHSSPSVDQIVTEDHQVRCRWRAPRETLPELHRQIVGDGVDLVSLAVKVDNLEDIYMRISGHRTS